MGQRIGGRLAAVLTMCFFGSLSPAFAADSEAGGSAGTMLETGGLNPDWGFGPDPCPTRFDYVVLASFADASNLLSLATYHFRSEASVTGAPLTDWQRVDIKAVESAGGDCPARPRSPREQTG